MRFSSLTSLLWFASIALAASCDSSIVAHEGEPVGFEEEHNGVNMYISLPSECTKTAVLYLTDVFGIQLAANKLLADSFARAGFLVVAPDMFNGTPAPEDINNGGFDTQAFLAAHDVNVTDPIIEATIKYMKEEMGVEKIATTGYCFGGRYAFRFVAEGKGADVAFTAHPSLLEDDEITAAVGAVSIAAAETDSLMSAERRAEIEALIQSTGTEYQISLYGGTSHGFGVRANISDPKQKFAKETAFFQAVRFFEAWL